MNKQSKSVQLALIFAVVCVWGLVAWRFRRLSSGNDDTSAMYSAPILPKKQQNAHDTLSLLLNYPNPFLPNSSQNMVTGSPHTRGRAPVASPKIISAGGSLPNVRYIGFSRDNTATKRARLLINGRGVTLSEGEQSNGIQLLQIDRDSVKIKWNALSQVLKRQ